MNIGVVLAIQIFAVVFAVFNVAMAIYDNRKDFGFIWTIWKRFRFSMFVEIIGIIALIYFAYAVQITLSPLFGYGWLNLIAKNGGNILITPVFYAFNSNSTLIRILPAIFLFSFLVSLPFMARLEENIFRRGVHTPGKMIRKSIIFGLMHLVIGIPIGAGIALIIPGLFFAYKYRKTYMRLAVGEADPFAASGATLLRQKRARNEGVLVSTTYHTLMNTIFMGYFLTSARPFFSLKYPYLPMLTIEKWVLHV